MNNKLHTMLGGIALATAMAASAPAFAEMGDVEGAREILNEVMREGTESQRMTAEEILQKYAS